MGRVAHTNAIQKVSRNVFIMSRSTQISLITAINKNKNAGIEHFEAMMLNTQSGS